MGFTLANLACILELIIAQNVETDCRYSKLHTQHGPTWFATEGKSKQ